MNDSIGADIFFYEASHIEALLSIMLPLQPLGLLLLLEAANLFSAAPVSDIPARPNRIG